MMSDVESFIYEYEGHQRDVMLHLHNLLVLDFNLVAKLRYQIPFYYRKSWICYMNPTRSGTIEFAFPRGNELSNDQGLLNSKGRKQVLSMEIANVAVIPTKSVAELIHEAVILDETTPYGSKRKKA